MQKIKKINEKVYSIDESIASINQDNLKFLEKILISKNFSNTRFLLHDNPNVRLHQMVIAHKKCVPIIPHININGPKSYVILKGKIAVVFFDSLGNVLKLINLSAQEESENKIVYWNESIFHTIIVQSEYSCILETTLGPHSSTQYADWAPKDVKDLSHWLNKILLEHADF